MVLSGLQRSSDQTEDLPFQASSVLEQTSINASTLARTVPLLFAISQVTSQTESQRISVLRRTLHKSSHCLAFNYLAAISVAIAAEYWEDDEKVELDMFKAAVCALFLGRT